MTLSPGQRLGPFEIVSAIGAGGMGEVWKAKDTRLDRTVALKVLPAELAADPERRRRLEQEARAVASLAHPHICTLYDIGREDGIDFLVLEYLEGETLAERLSRGALPLDEALRCARQMADALHQAHLRGVVHRDLKPGNVMLTKGGVKLLDFGLAKLKSPHVDPASSALSVSPTRSQPLTREGAILGTLHYMAPEQLEGKECDGRTDIFALGAVLYEMVTGRRAFEGESPASLITSIMSKTPTPMAKLTPLTPASLERLVSECLAKDPDARWQSASDLGMSLDWISEPTKETARPRGRLVPAILGTLLLLAAGANVLLLSRSEPEKTVVRFSIFPPEGTSFHARGMRMSVSPDGKHLAFVVESGGKSLLFVRPLEERDGHLLAQVDSSRLSVPFWSPDSREVAAVLGGKLMRFSVEGGAPRAIGDLGEDSRGQGAWNAKGVILVGTFFSGIERLSVSGGALSSVTRLEPGQAPHFFPSFLPDGERFLYSAVGSAEETRGVYLASILGGTKRLLSVASKAAYVEPGYVLYVREGTLFAERFDIDEEELLGDPIALAEEVAPSGFSVGGDVLAYRNGVGLNQLTWLDRDGRAVGAGEPAPYGTVTLSRDGKRAGVSDLGQSSDLWLLDLERGGLASRLTSTSFNEGDQIFSPDGRELAFGSRARGGNDLYRLPLAGDNDPILLLDAEEPVFPEDWSSDGKSIVFLRDAQGRKGVWALPLEGDGEPVRLVQGVELRHGRAPALSRRRWLAYIASDTGRFEVYLHSLDGGERARVSKDGGGQPRWRDDQRELFFLGLDGTLMSVDFDAQRGRAEIAKPLFQTGLSVDPTIDQYGVAPDGEKFLFLLPAGSDEPITVVVNWKTLLGS